MPKRERAYENRINELDQRAALKHRSRWVKVLANRDKGEVWRVHVQSANTMWQTDISKRGQTEETTLREKQPNSGKEDLQTSTASALPTLSLLSSNPKGPLKRIHSNLIILLEQKSHAKQKERESCEKTKKSSNH